ncbi:MAG: hypothetical protein QOJ07_438 [Thermoleophilaceae bacterium]|nr:hypothetical protein [Thermoleophilaceae bacterium]
MSPSSRIVPRVGMPVLVIHLGVWEEAFVEEVRDGGRAVVVEGELYTLRGTNARYVREGEPYYGRRIAFGTDADAP